MPAACARLHPRLAQIAQPITATTNQQREGNAWKGLDLLETFFAQTPPPTSPVQLDSVTTITNPAEFVLGHLEAVRSNQGKRAFLPYLERLEAFKNRLSAGQIAQT